MQVSQVKIRRLYDEGRMKALASVTIDDAIAVHDIKVIEGPLRTFVAMPSRKEEGGNFRDVVHPITPEAREKIEMAVLNSYFEAKRQNELKSL